MKLYKLTYKNRSTIVNSVAQAVEWYCLQKQLDRMLDDVNFSYVVEDEVLEDAK